MALAVAIAIIALSISAGGCGGGDERNASEDTADDSRCQPLPVAAADLLQQALYSGTISNGVYIRSSGFDHVFMVAGAVNGKGAVWAMNRLDGSGAIISVNEQAYQVSGMARGDSLADPITMSDDGAEEALSCVE